MRKKAKLAIIVKNIDGGTGTYLLTLQKLSGFEIKNFVLERPKYRKLSSSFGKKTVFFSKKAYPNLYFISLANIFSFASEAFWFRKNLSLFKPDIILAVDIHANLLTMTNKIFLGIEAPAVLTTHINLEKTLSQKSTKTLKNLIRFTAGLIYNRAEKNVCVSGGVASSLKRFLNLKSWPEIIYNGVPKRQKTKLNRSKPKIILSVARFDKQKDHETLIRAFNLVQKKLPEVELWLGGEGETKPFLKSLTKKLKIGKKVKFMGWIDPNFSLPDASLFVLSSKREGLPYGLLEAMACGVPVISTDVPFGPGEILENGKWGLLVTPGDTRKLSDAILTILKSNQKSLYYSKKAYERSRFFSEEKMLSAYNNLLGKLIQ